MGKYGLYGDSRPESYISLMWCIFKALVISFGALSIGIFILDDKTYSRLFFIMFGVLSFTLITSWRLLFQLYLDDISHGNPYSRNILIIGCPERGRYVKDLLEKQISWGHKVVGHLRIGKHDDSNCGIIGSCDELEKFIRENTVDEIIFALNGDQSMVCLSEYLRLCKKIGISCRILPTLWNPEDTTISIETFQGVPFLTLRTTSFNAIGLFYKRLLDLAGGLVGTFIFLIIYPFIAAAIKIDSPGPVIFRQKRIGKHGRIFYLLKFRTMHQNAEERLKELMTANEMDGAMFKLKNDPRITSVGKWLRKIP
jgi:hypothetical protein